MHNRNPLSGKDILYKPRGSLRKTLECKTCLKNRALIVFIWINGSRWLTEVTFVKKKKAFILGGGRDGFRLSVSPALSLLSTMTRLRLKERQWGGWHLVCEISNPTILKLWRGISGKPVSRYYSLSLSVSVFTLTHPPSYRVLGGGWALQPRDREQPS